MADPTTAIMQNNPINAPISILLYYFIPNISKYVSHKCPN